LREELPVIKKYRDKFFFFAVDSALPYLMSENVIPDAFICIEADKPMRFFEDERCKEIPLFTRINSTYKLMKKHTGKKIFGFDDGFMEKIYKKYDVPISVWRYGGNGATSLFAICRELGVQTVILTGQDMAYNKQKESHVFGRNEQFIYEEKFVLENNMGEKVQSRQDWYRFVKWYENAIPVCNFRKVINTAKEGVRIRGTSYMPLEDAIKKYGHTHKDMKTILNNTEKTFSQGRDIDVMQLYHECGKELAQISEIVKKDSRSEKRKNFDIYSLLELYEIADKGETLEERQKAGIMALQNHLKNCEGEG
jgi:hypothetical protein